MSQAAAGPQGPSAMNVEHINPFVVSTQNVFATMLDCEISRDRPFLKKQAEPYHDVNSVIELSGKAIGTVVLSLQRCVALKAASVMLKRQITEVDAEVVDAVGELVNIIAGGAKAKLERFALSVSLPRVSVGKQPLECFPPESKPICIPFECPWGGVMIEVGLVQRMTEMPVA